MLFSLSFPKRIRFSPTPVILSEAQRSRRTCGCPPWLSFPKGTRFSSARRTALTAALLLSTIPQNAQALPQRKLFTSPEDGITFTYPATWLLNADDDAATAKLSLADLAAPHAVVQLEGNFTGEGPYKATDFDAGAFAYTVVPADNVATCFALVDRLANQEGTPTLIGQQKAHEVRFSATVAGTEDIHHVAATFRPDRCVVLETVLIRRSADAVDHPLSPARWRQMENAFDSVLRSTRLTPQTTRN